MSTIDYVVKQLEALVNIPSPSGYTKQAVEYVEAAAKELFADIEARREKEGVIDRDALLSEITKDD